MHTELFACSRSGRSDFQLLVDLLDIVSNTILLTSIVLIVPVYTEAGLSLKVTYKQ